MISVRTFEPTLGNFEEFVQGCSLSYKFKEFPVLRFFDQLWFAHIGKTGIVTYSIASNFAKIKRKPNKKSHFVHKLFMIWKKRVFVHFG